jgi:ribosome recycling factor
MKEHVKSVRHDTLGAIAAGEKLVAALGDAEGKGTEKLRRATKRFVKHLKEELAAWEDKYKKARVEA